jgi:hypothetical protein
MTRSSLWSTEDHVLLAESNGFIERYRRYYFRDIQGFSVQPSTRGRVIAWVTGLPLLSCAIFAVFALTKVVRTEWLFLTIPIGLPFLILFLVNWVRGPTCTTTVFTAVSDAVLQPLGRQRAAFRTLTLLAKFIESVQGPIEPGQLGFQLEREDPASVARKVTLLGDVSAPRFSAQNTGAASEPPSPRTVYRWLFALGTIEGLHALTALGILVFGGRVVLQISYSAVIVAVLIISSAGLSRSGPSMKWLNVAAMIHTFFVGIGCFVAFYVGIFQRTFRNLAAAPHFDVTKFFDPSLPATVFVLWASVLGAATIVVGCLTNYLRQEGSN